MSHVVTLRTRQKSVFHWSLILFLHRCKTSDKHDDYSGQRLTPAFPLTRLLSPYLVKTAGESLSNILYELCSFLFSSICVFSVKDCYHSAMKAFSEPFLVIFRGTAPLKNKQDNTISLRSLTCEHSSVLRNNSLWVKRRKDKKKDNPCERNDKRQ